MKLLDLALGVLPFTAPASAWYTLSAYAPKHPEINGKIIHAWGRSFAIGADSPTTHCSEGPQICPPGVLTTVDRDMKELSTMTPGGQQIYVAEDGLITYTQAHSMYIPKGSQREGFYAEPVGPVTFLKWKSAEGKKGLWACPPDEGYKFLTLKASMPGFDGKGCTEIEKLQLLDAGDLSAAWQYT